MYKYKKNLNSILKKKYNKILTTYEYSLICKYNNVLPNQFFCLKKFLNKQNILHKTIKQTIFNNIYKTKGHGSLFILYFNCYNSFDSLLKHFKNNNNIYIIKFLNKHNYFSILKLEKIIKNKYSLSFCLKKSVVNLYFIILKIKKNKANIT